MTAPYLVIGLAGDSNGMWGKYRKTDGTDNCGARIFQYNQVGSVIVANEPLDNQGYGVADGGTGQVGSTVALCRLLRDNGHLPDSHDILIVPHCWAGTAMLDYWMVTPPYIDGVTGGRKALTPFINRLQAAMALHANNRFWFFDWNHGANDGGASAGGVDVYKGRITAMFAELRTVIPGASRAPILVSGFPMNRVTNPPYAAADFPYQMHVIDDIETVESYIENSHYCEPAQPPDAHYDSSNNYVHHTASTHRGGTNNAPSTRGEVHTVEESLAGLKYAALTSANVFPTRLTWT